MTSEAAAMSNPVSRGNGPVPGSLPTSIRRSTRSFMSSVRRKLIDAGSMPSGLPWISEASSIEASRLFAAAIAWMSPVKWRLMSSIGTSCACPPPAPPPLRPKTGPSEGSRRQRIGLRPIAPRPSVSPIAVVVLPSPKRVGVTAVTQTSLPCGPPAVRSRTRAAATFAFARPQGTISSGCRPASAATSAIGRPAAACAISRLPAPSLIRREPSSRRRAR